MRCQEFFMTIRNTMEKCDSTNTKLNTIDVQHNLNGEEIRNIFIIFSASLNDELCYGEKNNEKHKALDVRHKEQHRHYYCLSET